jgi:hypothetical protein
VPLSALATLPAALRYAGAAALMFTPIFLANLVFARSFKESDRPSFAFGANLAGAVVGGALEYLSLVIGYRGLFLVAAALYGVTALLDRNSDRGGIRGIK